MIRLNEEQIKVLRSAQIANDGTYKHGLRVSYTPSANSLWKRGLLEKRGSSKYRSYWLTPAGREALAELEKERT